MLGKYKIRSCEWQREWKSKWVGEIDSVSLMAKTGSCSVLVGLTGQASKLKPPHTETQSQLSKLDHLVSHPSITLKLFSYLFLCPVCETCGLSKNQTRALSPLVSTEIRSPGPWADSTTCPITASTHIYNVEHWALLMTLYVHVFSDHRLW